VARSAKWLFGGTLLFVVLGAVLFLEFLGPPKVVWRSEIREGNRLISGIEAFQRAHGRLPAELSELNKDAVQQGKLFYQMCDETSYVVWFGTTLGESMTYHSKSRDWLEASGGCK
jgi:hypothetical protein